MDPEEGIGTSFILIVNDGFDGMLILNVFPVRHNFACNMSQIELCKFSLDFFLRLLKFDHSLEDYVWSHINNEVIDRLHLVDAV